MKLTGKNMQQPRKKRGREGQQGTSDLVPKSIRNLLQPKKPKGKASKPKQPNVAESEKEEDKEGEVEPKEHKEKEASEDKDLPPFVLLTSQPSTTPAAKLFFESFDAVGQFSSEMKTRSLELEKYLRTVDLGDLTDKTTALCIRIFKFRTKCESFATAMIPTVNTLIRALNFYESPKGKAVFEETSEMLSPEHIDNPLGVLVDESADLVTELLLLLPLLKAKVTTWKERLRAIFGKMVESAGKLCFKIGLAVGTAATLGVAIPVAGVIIGAVGLAAASAKPIHDFASAYSKMTEHAKEVDNFNQQLAEQKAVVQRLGSYLRRLKAKASETYAACRMMEDSEEHRVGMKKMLEKLSDSLELLYDDHNLDR